MNSYTVDIETYSPQDITVTGAFRYAQDPEFEVLLLSYGPDPEHIVTIDFTDGSSGAAIARAKQVLLDPEITKRAHNAAFEWWCLSEWMGLTTQERSDWLEQWECTALHMRYCGLPGSLDMAGKALRLGEQKAKLKIGKALIQYFCKPCKPTKRNGQRTRNLPQHDPEKWALFTKYNAQDVTAEMELDRRTAAWPVPADIQRQWRDDLRMNALGVGIDRELVNGALVCAGKAASKLMAEAKTLTQLPNPNSPIQLLDWLRARGYALPNLAKDTVAGVLSNATLTSDCKRVLELPSGSG